MNTFKRVVTVVFLIAVSIITLQNKVHADVVVANSEATIQQPLTLAEITPLNFATILVGSAADTIVMGSDVASPTLTSTSGLSVLSGSFTRGEVRITGIPNTVTTVQLEESTTLSGPGADILVDDFTTATGTVNLGATGILNVLVGATLRINENQTPGVYTGTYNVTIAYQ